MATIAYKDGVIAYDSRCTRGTTITDDDAEKMETVKGVHLLCTGCTCDFDALIAAFFGATASAPVEASGYACDGETLWLIGHDDKTGFWKNRIRPDAGDAIVSGSAFALAAMDMGATAAGVRVLAGRFGRWWSCRMCIAKLQWLSGLRDSFRWGGDQKAAVRNQDRFAIRVTWNRDYMVAICHWDSVDRSAHVLYGQIFRRKPGPLVRRKASRRQLAAGVSDND